MAANTTPIFTLTPNVSWGTTAITAANTAKDGTGTTLTVFTAGSFGSFVKEVLFRTAGTNVATVARIFLNNGSSSATPANNILIGEVTLSATTISEVAANVPYSFAVNSPIQAGYKILVALGTAVSAGYYVSAWGGDY